MICPNFIIQPPVIAHRGASRVAPENTLAAFRQAKALGATWVEFDVMLTLDDEVVVIHDQSLNRTTNGVGQVRDYTYDHLRTLDAGSWFHAQFFEERIPSLKEVIDLLMELQLSANIEIKAQLGLEEITVKRVLSIVEQHWHKTAMPPLFSSFSLSILEGLRAASSDIALGFLMDMWRDDWHIPCDQLRAVSVNVNQAILSPERARAIKATDRLLLVYTVNDPDRAKALFSWGVDAVFSDVPLPLPVFSVGAYS